MSADAPLPAGELCQRAAKLIERRRYDHAATVLGEALAQYPDDSDLLYEAARLDYLQDRNAAALAAVLALLARDPAHFPARFLLYGLYEETGQLAQAELVLLDLLKEYPEASLLYARYAMLMYRTLHLAKAQALAREALRLDPDSELALTACLMGDMIEGRRDAQLASLAELIRKHPENAQTAHMLITHLVQRGQYRAAKRIAVELLRAQPDSRPILTLVVELEALSHWSMLPLWPLNRWGWAASIAFYFITLVFLSVLRQQAPQASGAATTALLAFVVYSWVYPPLLKRWLKRRAGI